MCHRISVDFQGGVAPPDGFSAVALIILGPIMRDGRRAVSQQRPGARVVTMEGIILRGDFSMSIWQLPLLRNCFLK